MVFPRVFRRHHHALYDESPGACLPAAQLQDRPAPDGAGPDGREPFQLHGRHRRQPRHHHHRQAGEVRQVRDHRVLAQAAADERHGGQDRPQSVADHRQGPFRGRGCRHPVGPRDHLSGPGRAAQLQRRLHLHRDSRRRRDQGGILCRQGYSRKDRLWREPHQRRDAVQSGSVLRDGASGLQGGGERVHGRDRLWRTCPWA